jgi:hypothetical protein
MAAAAADPLRIIVGIPQKTGRNAKYDPLPNSKNEIANGKSWSDTRTKSPPAVGK